MEPDGDAGPLAQRRTHLGVIAIIELDHNNGVAAEWPERFRRRVSEKTGDLAERSHARRVRGGILGRSRHTFTLVEAS
jgi:hypothetical protein